MVLPPPPSFPQCNHRDLPCVDYHGQSGDRDCELQVAPMAEDIGDEKEAEHAERSK